MQTPAQIAQQINDVYTSEYTFGRMEAIILDILEKWQKEVSENAINSLD